MKNISPKTCEEKTQEWWKQNTKWVVMGMFVIALFSLGIKFLISPPAWLNSYEKPGTIGDYFNGLMGPFIALIAAIGTFAAFIVQYQANQAQKAALKEQSIQFLHDRFEQRFMEMIKMHRENVASIVYNIPSLEELKGPNGIQGIVVEIDITNDSLVNIISELATRLPAENTLKNAIRIVFKGLDSISNHNWIFEPIENLEFDLDWYSAISFLKGKAIYFGLERYDGLRFEWQRRVIEDRKIYATKFCPPLGKDNVQNLNMVPWRGQHQTLSPYLRHLNLTYQMLDEAAFSPVAILTPDQTRFYTDFLRSQITLEEQKLLFYLSLTEVLSHWWTQNWMSRYNPIADLQQENLPAGLDLEALKNQMQPN